MQAESQTSATLIDLVIPYIRQEDIFSFQATSRLCRNRALPTFYANLSLTCRSGDGGSRKLFLLLRSLLYDPSLPPLVKSLSVFDVTNQRKARSVNRDGPKVDSAIPKLTEQDRDLLQKAIQPANLPSADRWLTCLQSDQVASIILPLILWYTKSLRHLHLDCGFYASSHFLRVVMKPSAEIQSQSSTEPDRPFSQLRKVTFAAMETEKPRFHAVEGWGHIQGLFFLPSIEHINVPVDQPSFPGLTPLIDAGHQPNPRFLRILDLRRSEIDHQILHDLLSALPHLTTLSYEWWRDIDTGGKDNKIFEPQEFMKALSPLHPTLRSLSLDISFWCTTFDIGINPGWYGIRGCLTDLSEWQGITSLRMPLMILLAESKEGYMLPSFPRSLEQLTVTEDGFDLCTYDFEPDDVRSALQEFLDSWLSNYPSLKKITFEVRDPCDNDIWEDDVREAVKTQCDGAGVPCRFVSNTLG